MSPVTVPNVIARKYTGYVSPPTLKENISRLAKGKERAQPVGTTNGDEYSIVVTSDDPVSSRSSLLLADSGFFTGGRKDRCNTVLS